MPLNKINALDLQKYLNSVSRSRTAVDVYDILHNSLKIAVQCDLLLKNPCDCVRKPKHIRKIGSALDKLELIEFLKKVKGHRLEFYFKFCLFSGCRRSEALSVCWSDIDFKSNLIHIKGTKTDLSDRLIPLFHDLKQLLENAKVIDNKVFHHRASYVTHEFKKLCPKHKLHDLRHTFATRCLECGIDMKVVQVWLGHSSMLMTEKIYSHVLQDFAFLQAEKLKIFDN